MQTLLHPKKRKLLTVCVAICFFMLFYNPSLASSLISPNAEETEFAARNIYRSPNERREAGLGTEVTKWLKASLLLESETSQLNTRFNEPLSNKETTENSHSIQLGLGLTLSDTVNSELVFEYEADHGTDQQHSKLDEGIIKYDGNYWDLELGRLFVPFGEYFSHFISGPMLEFGETSGKGMVINMEASDFLDVFIFGLKGDMNKTNTRGDEIDWGIGMEFNSSDESIKLGLGLMSDLADADESLLEDTDNSYEQRIPAFSLFALYGKRHFEVTTELIRAMREFPELEDATNKPWAANLELAWFPQPAYQFALRYEASNELEDQPEHQVGLSATWLIGSHINLAAEYLYGEFKNGFVSDDNDHELDSNNQISARIGVEF